MLCKFQLCLRYIEKWKEVPKCIEAKAWLIIKGSALRTIDVTEHPLHMSFLYKVDFMYQLHTS